MRPMPIQPMRWVLFAIMPPATSVIPKSGHRFSDQIMLKLSARQ
jgi:hypothetical protein